MTISVNPDITIAHTAHFQRLVLEIEKRGLNGPQYAHLVVKAGLESGILVGAKPDEVDGMKTGRILVLSNKATDAYIAELKPIDDPN
jgi:hypothetical protein